MFVKREIHIICLLLLFHLCVYAGDKVVKIACVGNSITYGARLKNPSKDSYPGVLEQMLGKGYDVRNFGVSARTMLNKGDHPYMKEKKYKDALDFNPDIVIIKLGTNDSKPINWVYKSDFMNDTELLINSFKSLSSKPRIILCLPVPSIPNGKNINNEVICNEIIPLLKKAAKKLDVEIFDFYNAMSPYYPELFPDDVHPNARGAEIMAGLIYNKITGKKAPD